MTTDAKVFVVDDDPAVGDALGVLLEILGYDVEVFGSGLDFLESADPGQADCLLLDVSMPGIDGLELQKRLRERGHGVPVVFMTAHADVPIAIRAMKDGALDFIEKPFTDTQIREAVAGAIEAGRARRSRTADTGEAHEYLARLTPREREVLELLVAGRQNKVIAYELEMSPRTVEKHRARVMEKFEARSLSQLVRLALAAGITGPSG